MFIQWAQRILGVHHVISDYHEIHTKLSYPILILSPKKKASADDPSYLSLVYNTHTADSIVDLTLTEQAFLCTITDPL